MIKQVLQVQKIYHSVATIAGVKLFMARADQFHPLASGNKIYKLKPHLDYAKKNNIKRLISFGGAYSNHIYALAMMAKEYGFESIGIIRGEKDYANNPTLQDAKNAGMNLEFVNREEYKLRNTAEYIHGLEKRYDNVLIIPEGGSSQLAISGCAQLAKDINISQPSDIISVACGTGATIAGVVCGLIGNQSAIGYSVLKDKSLGKRVQQFIDKENCINKNYKIEEADFGGYAKFDKELLDFVIDWLKKTGILLDPIYTSKMCMRLIQQTEAGEFNSSTSITIVHSGGLQGWRGMEKRVIQLAGESQWKKIASLLQTENHAKGGGVS